MTGLTGFEIRREGLDYRYVLPPRWTEKNPDALEALRFLLCEELVPLLEELTGPVVIRKLRQVPELRASAILGEEKSNP